MAHLIRYRMKEREIDRLEKALGEINRTFLDGGLDQQQPNLGVQNSTRMQQEDFVARLFPEEDLPVGELENKISSKVRQVSSTQIPTTDSTPEIGDVSDDSDGASDSLNYPVKTNSTAAMNSSPFDAPGAPVSSQAPLDIQKSTTDSVDDGDEREYSTVSPKHDGDKE